MAESEVLRRRVADEEVYRPIFDAEVDLVESLEREIRPVTPKSPVLPLVRESRAVTGHGILTRRQKTWTEGRPNEGKVENPVYYKYTSLESHCHTVLPNDAEAAREVRGLPETPEAPKERSDIIERLEASRKERHESTLEDMYQEFGVINAELEPRIIEASESLKDLLLENDKEVDRLLSSVASDDALLNYSLKELHGLWDRIAEQSSVRQRWIADLDQALRKVEQDRSNMICEALKSYNKTLERIAHLMPPDVHRLLEREAQQVNSTVLLNLRAYADLVARLATADVERERTCYTAWQTRLEDWRQLKVHVAIAKFSDFMASPFIRDPPEVRHQSELFTREQSTLNRKRLELLNSLSNMKPPNSTKSAVYQWNAALTELFEQLEEVHTKYKEILQAEYDKVIQQCVEQVELFKEALLDEGVLDEVRIEEVMNESFLPLVGEKKTKYEYEVDKMERSLDNLMSWQEMMVKSLFKYVQGAAHLWDLHEIGLARQERSLQEKLERNRQDHDGNNQVKEANLDIIMDKMRQDSSEQVLKHSLQQALDLLGQIQEMYKEFHKTQVESTKAYPDLVQEELTKYDTEICSYLQVGRSKPAKAAEPQVTLKADQTKGKRNVKSSPQSLDDVLKTSNGTTFYILVEPGEHGLPDSPESIKSMKTCVTFITDNLEDEDEFLPSYLEAIGISDEIFMYLRRNLRLEFLEHLEEWKAQALHKADSVVSAKLEELNSELDLRLHLHEPRAARAEQDVHHVRAAELIMHRERVERHCKGVTTSLGEFKARFQEMVEEHDKETEIFKQSVQELEATFTSATKTHELLTIQDQVTGRVEQYMTVIRTSIRKFRHDLDDMLSNLRNSNARFRKTFKVFSEGGNFSTDEVEEYRKKLERMATKIDSSEGSFMAELEGMETKRLEASTDYAGKLEDRFKHHLFDLTFMEKVTRWLTNTQVKIKSEVAFSNSQAKRLAIYLATFERHIDAVERPNLDKEQVTARDVQASLIPILQTFHERSLYLNCLLNPATPSLIVLQTGLKSGTGGKNVDNKEDEKKERAGLKSKKSKKRIKVVSEGDTEDNGKPKTTPYSSRADKMTAEEGSRPKTVPSDTKVAVKRSGSGSDKQSRQRSAGSRRTSATKREQQGPRYDRKFLVFGDKMEDEKHFMARIRNILRAGLEGLLATAEMFYRQKGQRSPTRPQAIHESFELCADALVQRLVNYRTQAEEYHNSCIQELRSQLQKFAVALVHLPPLVVDVTVSEHVTELRKEREKSEGDYQTQVQELQRRKTLHQSQLRPSLGHPHNRDELETLCASEERRRKETLEGTKEHAELLGALEAQFAESYIEKLSQTCETMLLQFDAVLTLDDVEVGKVEAKPKSTRRLLREKLTGAEEETDKLAPFPSEGATWEGLPTNELVLEENTEKKIRTPSIKTVKTTQGHLAVIKSRDRAYADYKEKFYSRLSTIREAMNVRILNEEKWTRSWKRSIAKIKELY